MALRVPERGCAVVGLCRLLMPLRGVVMKTGCLGHGASIALSWPRRRGDLRAGRRGPAGMRAVTAAPGRRMKVKWSCWCGVSGERVGAGAGDDESKRRLGPVGLPRDLLC